jgi:hypothetical protein
VSRSADSHGLGLNLSGVTLGLEGLSDRLLERLRREWAPFVSGPHDCPFLRVDVAFGERDPSVGGAYEPKSMKSLLTSDSARYSMPEGSAEIVSSGRATIRLGRDLGEREYFTLVNLLRACLAWSLPSRGGALLHAAGLVVAGRAFLMVGPEGSGKSTWTALGEREGARVLSDDLVLVDGIAPCLEALGAPFRSTHRFRFRPGRWPVAAVFFPRHGIGPGWSAVPALIAKARVAANLPFIAEGIERDPRISMLVDRFADSVPCLEFTFGTESRFLALLESWPERD